MKTEDNKNKNEFMNRDRIDKIRSYFTVARDDSREKKEVFCEKLWAKISRLFSRKRKASGVHACDVHKKLEVRQITRNTFLRSEKSVIGEKIKNLNIFQKLKINIIPRPWNYVEKGKEEKPAQNKYYSIPRSRYKSIEDMAAKDSNTTNEWNVGRLFKRNVFRLNIFKKALALATIFAVIITVYFQNNQQASGATEAL